MYFALKRLLQKTQSMWMSLREATIDFPLFFGRGIAKDMFAIIGSHPR